MTQQNRTQPRHVPAQCEIIVCLRIVFMQFSNKFFFYFLFTSNSNSQQNSFIFLSFSAAPSSGAIGHARTGARVAHLNGAVEECLCRVFENEGFEAKRREIVHAVVEDFNDADVELGSDWTEVFHEQIFHCVVCIRARNQLFRNKAQIEGFHLFFNPCEESDQYIVHLS